MKKKKTVVKAEKGEATKAASATKKTPTSAKKTANDGAMAWRGSAKQAQVGTLPELHSMTAVCSLAGELAMQLVKAE